MSAASASHTRRTSDRELIPVVLGGDIGVYGIGRSFNEAFGCRCICVSSAPIEAITRSVFFDVERLPANADDPQLLAVLLGLAAANPGADLVLMANHDVHSVFIASNAQVLAPHYALPFPDQRTVDLVTDKASFARICADLGILTPRTVSVDFAHGDDPSWSAPAIPFAFPVVAKAARGDAYDAIHFEGKRKIWFITNPDELTDLWSALKTANFRDTFLVQELIPGDNTAMRSLTAYVDSHGTATLIGSARVLLEDHAPTMIGNPVAMITEPFERLWDDARRFLESTNYRGFANFDVKIDPRDGRAIFFEVNPRIGRNNWYMTAAGHNPMVPMVADLVDNKRVTPRTVTEEILYSLVPDRLLLHYIRDDALRTRVRGLIESHKRFDPLEYPAETNVRRRLTVALLKTNQYRKFRRYYPEATDQSF